MIDNLRHLSQTAASFALVLGVLVSIHEMGHYLAARWCRIGVEAFSLGFGPTLKSWVDRRGTIWKLSLLPLGGYVKMHAMTPEEAQEAGADFRPAEAFTHKKVWQRATVIAAGPIANFLLAIILFAGLQAVVGASVPLPVIGTVMADSAAAKAGLKANDEVLSAAGATVKTFDDLRAIVAASPDKDLALTIKRDGQIATVTVHIRAVGINHSTGQLGVLSGKFETVRRGPLEALQGGATQTWHLVVQTLDGLGGLITTGDGAGDLGGPIAIAHLSGQVAQLGAVSLITFIAMLSVNLGLLNLLPIPILDGGHLLFLAAEAIRGRPVPQRAQEYGIGLGAGIIATVFLFVSFNDLGREGAWHWLHKLLG